MKKSILILSILAFIIVILIIILILPAGFWQQKNNQQELPQVEAKGIHIISPKISERVSSPIKIAGKVNGQGWDGFEGQVGSVKLVDANENILAQEPLTAITDWTQEEISFKTELTFNSNYRGPAILFFHNENASGDPQRDKEVAWPVIIK